MTAISSVFGWMALGLAASLVAMALPNRRGYAGVLTNIVVGVAGALACGFLGRGVGLIHRVTDPSGFLLATVGALLALVGYHVAFNRSHPGAA